MKRTHRLYSPRTIRLISLVLCYALIVTAVFLPLSSSVGGSGANGINPVAISTSSRFMQRSEIFGAPGGLLASLLTFFQGGGGLPSVPGPNLPDLDAARQVQAADPTAPTEPSELEMAVPQVCDNCDPNTRPVAIIGGPYSGVATQSISFHGSDSFDPDGNSITLQWNFGDGGSASVANPTHVYAAAGSYTVTLVVTDDLRLASSPATTSVSVSAVPASTPSPTPTATPTPPPGTNNAVFISQSVPTTMTATNTYAVSVTMRNTGSTTWTAAHLYRLASQSQGNDSVWGMNRVYLAADVLPGADATFSFSVIAPPGLPPGRRGGGTHYQFQWRMIQDGVGSFGETSTAADVVSFGNMLPIQVYTPQNHYLARLEPRNRTGGGGEDLLSRNFNWRSGILGLAGRAGLDLDLGLSYNSLVWTRVSSSMIFDADRGFPSAGFRLGFPAIQTKFFNNQAHTYSYLMITPSGGRVELRQAQAAGVFESVDSSHLQLIEGEGNGLLLTDMSGTQMTYLLINGEFRCTSIKDRNGNYLTIKYDPLNGVPNLGRVTSIVDTLQRTINFNYDTKLYLRNITQTRNGAVHTIATFAYEPRTLQTNFVEASGNGTTTVLGLPSDNTIAVLTQIGLDDGSRYKFDYNSWGQVNQVTHFAADSAKDDGHPLSYVSYNLPLDNTASQTDCPRFTERRDWVENWNGGAEAVTSYAYNENAIGANGTLWDVLEWTQVEFPDHTKYREYATVNYDDWQRGLTTKTEVYSVDNSSIPKKTTLTDWTQDHTDVGYQVNPRATASTISDSDGNSRRTTIDYTSLGLPSDVFEWGPEGDAWTLLRRTHTDYESSADYVSRHILGLTKAQFLFGPEDNRQRLYSKVSYEYDAGGEFLQSQGNPLQHDSAYGIGSLVRGNVTKALRWDANDETDIAHATASTVGYNTCGSIIFSRDPLGHQTTIGYTDSFSSNGIDTTTAPGLTLAYATTVTINDPTAISSTAKYHYDLGRVTREQDPKGAAQTTEYDSAGRVKRIANAVNGAYTRFVYPSSQTIVNKFTTINDLATETYTATVYDGAGRVRAVAGDFPNSAGHYSGQFTLYDINGRSVQQTNPTEMNYQWAAAGDDATGWHSTSQTFDWKGRPLITTNPDGTTKEASYGGCGCAGGAVVTLTDEGTVDGGVAKRRQEKIYSDALGRTVKTEVLNWQGGSPYSTTINSYNARDQIKSVRLYQGDEASGVYQETTVGYDGYGRLRTKHIPQQDSGTATVWDYNADDTVQKVTDARGSITNYSYNARHLMIGMTYDPSAGVSDTPDVVFGYDAAANRTSMTDGLGSVSYAYSQLSQLTFETRTFNGIGTFQVGYDYNPGGELKKITDSTNMTIDYGYDSAGRLNGITGSDNLYNDVSNYASNFHYRAWGGLKAMTDGKGYVSSLLYNAKLQPTHFEISGNIVSQDYDYNSDGRIKIVHNPTDQNFDRSYAYDQAGRLTEAKSGGDVNGYQYAPIPYHETFGYDAFSNLTARQSQSWNGQTDNTDAATYTNNRRGGWAYDADGRNTAIDTRTNTFDAAGKQIGMNATAITFNGSSYTVTQAISHDGDGATAKEVTARLNVPGSENTTYYLRSSVLGGAIVEEINSNGQKNVGYVYSPGGELLATQTPNYPTNMVTWKHRTPVGTGQYTVNTYNSVTGRTEFEPLGADVSVTAPAEPPPGEGGGDVGAGHFGGLMDSRWSDFFNLSSGCMRAGVAASCSQVMEEVNSAGSATPNAAPLSYFHIRGLQPPGSVPIDLAPQFRDWLFRTRNIFNPEAEDFNLSAFDKDYMFELQNPAFNLNRDEVSLLIDSIFKYFKEHPKCEAAINRILDELRSEHDAGSIGSILESFRTNGNISVYPSRYLSGVADPWPNVNISSAANRTKDALTVMGEIIHSAGIVSDGNGGYAHHFSDPAIANVLIKSGVVMSVEQYRKTYAATIQRQRSEGWLSDYADSALAHGGIAILCENAVNGVSPKSAIP